MKIVKDSNDQYHAQKSISASGLKEISKNSVYHYLNRLPFESSAMALGTAVHTALLEPDTFYDIYYPMPEIKDARTKEGRLLKKEAEEKSEGKICLSFWDYKKIKTILKNFKSNKLARAYCKGEVELSHYLKHDNVDVRVRPDVINHVSDFICDVKTTQDASPKAFRSSIYKFNYHLQAAFYMDMLGINNFKFVVCETNHPHAVVVYTLDDDMIELGRKKWQQAFNDWKNYLDNGQINLYHSETFDVDGSYLISNIWKNIEK
jgi:hypothetical protein